MKILEKIVGKRTFTGPNCNVFTSKYFTTLKYAAAVLIASPHKIHGGIAWQTFKTKKEAEQWQPTYPRDYYDTLEEAQSAFNSLKKYTK